MVGVLHVTQTLAQIMLFWKEDLLDLAGKGVQWHVNILCVPDFL